MGGMAQLALGNFIVFALAALLILYIIYLFIKRAVEKNDGDYTLEAEEYRGSKLRKSIFTFLNSAMTAWLFYLVVGGEIAGAIIYFVVFFTVRLLTPERARKPKSSRSKMFSKVFSIISLLLLVFLSVIWTASISTKVSAWLVLVIIYLLEKIEEKFFISGNAKGHDL